MAVKRIVANIATPDLAGAGVFYGEILGMTVAMDHGWIATYASPLETVAQISFAREGGSGTAVPNLSIEVDNFDEVHARILKAELPVEYGPINEIWGVRRLFLRDPFGRLVNILSHS
ncbi:VOC family protein [Rhizobium nepotum]|uniref:Glyoxalase n=1 Tax=Rhizobium nepotum 39/7 TaxID=1368418 RepID=A0ABR5CKK7_9HYPH|nr:VOC family protein [Rhizobium nepotum]KJF65389.1 glyoxalase [Rhizobium nepotum 39/7]